MRRRRLVIKHFSRFTVLLVNLGVLYLGNLFLCVTYTPEDLVIDLADVERNIGTLDAFDDDFLNSEQQITKEIDAS